jgi:AcrR family transcriptional regulator
MAIGEIIHWPAGKGGAAKTRLLEAAILLFGDRGLEGASVRDITKAAGQNVAAIKYHFGGKEQLYHAVLEAIIGEIRRRLTDVFEEIEEARRRGGMTPDQAVALLQKFFRSVYLRLLSRDEAVAIGKLMVREQMQPTAGFDVLYSQGIREFHEALCFLVGTALGRNPREKEIIVRTHMLMGQVYFFAMTRATILRRLGWSSLQGRNADWVAELLAENVASLLARLQQIPAHGNRLS